MKTITDVWQLRRHASVPHISRTYRLLDKFTFDDRKKLMHATYEDMLEHGLEDLFKQKLATVFSDNGKYVICYFTPDLVDTEYNSLVNYLPRRGVSVPHTIDELALSDAENFLEAIRISIRAMFRVAEQRRERLRKVYVIQHVGPEE